MAGKHVVDGQFKSDKYPWCPPGFFALKLSDPMAQDLILEYARRHRAVDAELSDDLAALLPGVERADRCANCSHWADSRPERGDRPLAFKDTDHRPCKAAPHANYATADDSAMGKRRMAVVDGEGYHAELWTEPGFSCALFAQGTWAKHVDLGDLPPVLRIDPPEDVGGVQRVAEIDDGTGASLYEPTEAAAEELEALRRQHESFAAGLAEKLHPMSRKP